MCRDKSTRERIEDLINIPISRAYDINDYNESKSLTYSFNGKLSLSNFKPMESRVELLEKKYHEITYDSLVYFIEKDSLETILRDNIFRVDKNEILYRLKPNESLFYKKNTYYRIVIYQDTIYFRQYDEIFD